MESITINWFTLIGQVINFAILFFLLSRFVFKPLTGVLKERRDKIQEGVEKSEKAEEHLQKIRDMKKEMEKKNEEERKNVLIKAEEEAQKRKQEAEKEVKTEKEDLLKKAQKEAEKIKEQKIREAEQETIKNAINIAEKILLESVDKEKNAKIINQYLDRIN